MRFIDPSMWLLLPLFLPALWFFGVNRKTVPHTQPALHGGIHSLSAAGWMLKGLYLALWVVLVAAVARPVWREVVFNPRGAGANIILAVDGSDSMNWGILSQKEKQLAASKNGGNPYSMPSIFSKERQRPKNIEKRIVVAETAIEAFIKQRKGDRLGYFLFDSEAHLVWPLTTALDIVTAKNSGIRRYTGFGTNFDGPSEANPSLGPLQAAIDHFKEPELQADGTRILILVTDGEAPIEKGRFGQLLNEMRELSVRFYVLAIGPNWLEDPMTEDLRRFTTDLGGMVIAVENGVDMQKAFDEINRMQKSNFETEPSVNDADVFQILLSWLAMPVLLLYLLMTALLCERP